MSRELVIASKNAGKIREIRAIFADLPVAVVEVGNLPDVVEDGDSFRANAVKKAVEIAKFTRKWALADDSGLEVDALGGKPGIHSARWSGKGDEANNDLLLAELKDVPDDKRTARYRAVVVVATPKGEVVAEADGVFEGVIGRERLGKGGFGYDPLFVLPWQGKTVAELPSELKNRISHRAQALERIRAPLTRALAELR